jgi:two-component system LytT family response regulator
LDGFEVLKALPAARRPLVVFATAFDQYAVTAFEESAVDYLMKPIEQERLAKAVAKLRGRIGTPSAGVERLLAHLAGSNVAYLKRITAKKLQKYHVLAIESIEAFVVEDELVFAVTPQGRFLVSSTLRELETKLDPAQFARVHKQTIANLTKVIELEPVLKGGASARLASGGTIEISRRYAPELREKLGW